MPHMHQFTPADLVGYSVPMVVEQTSRGERGYDIFSLLLKNRIVFLGSAVDDDVANWYVRQSRKRFYDVDTADNRAAFATLHEVLTVVCRLLAPFAPFVTDWVSI